MAHNPAIDRAMISQRIRECIIALGVAVILGASVYLWQQQYAIDLPAPPPAQPIGGKPVQPREEDMSRSAAHRASPAASPGAWFSDADYPAEALRNGWEGTTGFRLTIDPSGRVARCDISQSSGHAVLDEATCRLLIRHASFRPARDASGAPATDSYNGRVSWRMPD